MACSMRPYHHYVYPSYARRAPSALAMADQLFDGFESIFELPLGWLDEMLDMDNPAAVQQSHGRTTEIVSDKDKFKVELDANGFKPDELSVTCVKDRFILVQGKHQEWEDKENEKGYVTREFKRSYVVPKGVDLTKLKSNLSKEGVLSLEAPKSELAVDNERVIPIEYEESGNANGPK